MTATSSRARIAAWRILIALIYVFLLAPLVVVTIISFDTRPYLAFPPQDLSFGS